MKLTHQGEKELSRIAQKYGFSEGAVLTLWQSIVAGGGTMAQFNHPELGGMGQWMKGGMTMIGDMFNASLKGNIISASEELSLLFNSSEFTREEKIAPFNTPSSSHNWWPEEWGSPSMSGAQNQMRYAYFPHHNRLIIQHTDGTHVYDTKGFLLLGVSQQQGGLQSLTFSSQQGEVSLTDFKELKHE